MSNRNPRQLHSFTNFTGNPYIYYNGVTIPLNFNCDDRSERPFRTIVRHNNDPIDVNNIDRKACVTPYELWEKKCLY